MSEQQQQNKQVAQPTTVSRQCKFTIELADDRNRNPAFPPEGRILRGRWNSRVLIGVSAATALADMPDVPGIHIELDVPRRAARLYDPLGLPENAKLFDVVKSRFFQLERRHCGPEDTVVRSNMTDGDMKTWAYWMIRLVHGGSARVVSGTMPNLDEIAGWPGKTRVSQFKRSAGYMYREDAELVGV